MLLGVPWTNPFSYDWTFTLFVFKIRKFYLFIFLNFILLFNFTILYWFCHISTWIRHRYTHAPHPERSSLLPPWIIPLGRPSAPAPSIQYRALNLDWWLVSYMILYMFQCHSPKSSHPLPLPQSRKDCSIHQCLFCCLIYRVIVNLSGTLRACLVLIYNPFFPFSSWIFSYHLLLAGVLLKCVDYIESQCFLEPFVRLWLLLPPGNSLSCLHYCYEKEITTLPSSWISTDSLCCTPETSTVM